MIYILGEILIGRRRTLETKLNHSTKTLRYDMLCFVKKLKERKVCMENKKLETITKLFEGSQIRSVWDNELEDYYFSVVDVISVLTGSSNPRDYWFKLKIRMTEEEKSELSTKCRRLKMKAQDGKLRETDTLDTEGILRLIESIPSPKAEPFKLWLARLGRERIDEVFDRYEKWVQATCLST